MKRQHKITEIPYSQENVINTVPGKEQKFLHNNDLLERKFHSLINDLSPARNISTVNLSGSTFPGDACTFNSKSENVAKISIVLPDSNVKVIDQDQSPWVWRQDDSPLQLEETTMISLTPESIKRQRANLCTNYEDLAEQENLDKRKVLESTNSSIPRPSTSHEIQSCSSSTISVLSGFRNSPVRTGENTCDPLTKSSEFQLSKTRIVHQKGSKHSGTFNDSLCYTVSSGSIKKGDSFEEIANRIETPKPVRDAVSSYPPPQNIQDESKDSYSSLGEITDRLPTFPDQGIDENTEFVPRTGPSKNLCQIQLKSRPLLLNTSINSAAATLDYDPAISDRVLGWKSVFRSCGGRSRTLEPSSSGGSSLVQSRYLSSHQFSGSRRLGSEFILTSNATTVQSTPQTLGSAVAASVSSTEVYSTEYNRLMVKYGTGNASHMSSSVEEFLGYSGDFGTKSNNTSCPSIGEATLSLSDAFSSTYSITSRRKNWSDNSLPLQSCEPVSSINISVSDISSATPTPHIPFEQVNDESDATPYPVSSSNEYGRNSFEEPRPAISESIAIPKVFKGFRTRIKSRKKRHKSLRLGKASVGSQKNEPLSVEESSSKNRDLRAANGIQLIPVAACPDESPVKPPVEDEHPMLSSMEPGNPNKMVGLTQLWCRIEKRLKSYGAKGIPGLDPDVGNAFGLIDNTLPIGQKKSWHNDMESKLEMLLSNVDVIELLKLFDKVLVNTDLPNPREPCLPRVYQQNDALRQSNEKLREKITALERLLREARDTTSEKTLVGKQLQIEALENERQLILKELSDEKQKLRVVAIQKRVQEMAAKQMKLELERLGEKEHRLRKRAQAAILKYRQLGTLTDKKNSVGSVIGFAKDSSRKLKNTRLSNAFPRDGLSEIVWFYEAKVDDLLQNMTDKGSKIVKNAAKGNSQIKPSLSVVRPPAILTIFNQGNSAPPFSNQGYLQTLIQGKLNECQSEINKFEQQLGSTQTTSCENTNFTHNTTWSIMPDNLGLTRPDSTVPMRELIANDKLLHQAKFASKLVQLPQDEMSKIVYQCCRTLGTTDPMALPSAISQLRSDQMSYVAESNNIANLISLTHSTDSTNAVKIVSQWRDIVVKDAGYSLRPCIIEALKTALLPNNESDFSDTPNSVLAAMLKNNVTSGLHLGTLNKEIVALLMNTFNIPKLSMCNTAIERLSIKVKEHIRFYRRVIEILNVGHTALPTEILNRIEGLSSGSSGLLSPEIIFVFKVFKSIQLRLSLPEHPEAPWSTLIEDGGIVGDCESTGNSSSGGSLRSGPGGSWESWRNECLFTVDLMARMVEHSKWGKNTKLTQKT